MLTLRTGVPGSGKTLETVREMLAWAKRDESRPLFTHGIPELVGVSAAPLPVFSVARIAKGGLEVGRQLEVQWADIPDGARVVIDEAQAIFPPRPAGSAVPAYVSFLNVHRHRGIDIVVITQHPRLIDVSVRKLVGRHQHFRRVFGSVYHLIYEWDHCADALQGMAEANKTLQRFPSGVFAHYKSAEVHTKPKMARPLWLAVPVLALGAVIWYAPQAYRVLSGAIGGRGVGGGAAAAASAPAASGAAAASAPGAGASGPSAGGLLSAAAMMRGRGLAGDSRPWSLQGVPVGRPVVASWVQPAATWPALVGGCWLVGDECRCVTNESPPHVLTMEADAVCREVAAGRYSVDPGRPYPRGRSDEATRPAGAAEPTPAGAASSPAGAGAGAAQAALSPGSIAGSAIGSAFGR